MHMENVINKDKSKKAAQKRNITEVSCLCGIFFPIYEQIKYNKFSSIHYSAYGVKVHVVSGYKVKCNASVGMNNSYRPIKLVGLSFSFSVLSFHNCVLSIHSQKPFRF